MGFRPRQGRGVVPLTECPVAQAGINRMLTPLREVLSSGWTNRGRGERLSSREHRRRCLCP